MFDTTTYEFTRTPEERLALISGTAAFTAVAEILEADGHELTVDQFAKACQATLALTSGLAIHTADLDYGPDNDGLEAMPYAEAKQEYPAALARIVRLWDTDRPAAFRAARSAALLRSRLWQERDDLNGLVFPWHDSEAHEYADALDDGTEDKSLFKTYLPKDEKPRDRLDVRQIVKDCLDRNGGPMTDVEIAAETGLTAEELQGARIGSYSLIAVDD